MLFCSPSVWLPSHRRTLGYLFTRVGWGKHDESHGTNTFAELLGLFDILLLPNCPIVEDFYIVLSLGRWNADEVYELTTRTTGKFFMSGRGITCPAVIVITATTYNDIMTCFHYL